jgi:hypothetical protein
LRGQKIAAREYPNFFAKLLALMSKREKDKRISGEVAPSSRVISGNQKAQKTRLTYKRVFCAFATCVAYLKINLRLDIKLDTLGQR